MGKMGQYGNGDDKDFVLSSSYQDNQSLESREDIYHGSGRNASGGQAFKHIYIAIGGFLILIVLSVVGIARTYSLAEKVQLLALESRFEQLENRLGLIEGEGGLAQTAGQGNPLILLTERLDQLEANMTARINSVANQLNTAPAKPIAETATKTETAVPAPEVKKETKAKIHTVKQGETLYRISRRYNLTVEQLRQYNQLDQKASIYPGQKLKVSSPK
jgi:LysM repeat protein